MRRMVLLLLVVGWLPARASASSITCTVTGPTSVTILESANEADETGAGTCKITGVPLPSRSAVINLLENPSAPDFVSDKPVSDFMEITPAGEINLLSDANGKGLPARGGATLEVTEPVGFGPVVFTIEGTTYTVFSDVTPEPSTILLFGSGLLAFFARRKVR
jgi:PEP-CTERM motif